MSKKITVDGNEGTRSSDVLRPDHTRVICNECSKELFIVCYWSGVRGTDTMNANPMSSHRGSAEMKGVNHYKLATTTHRNRIIPVSFWRTKKYAR
jgi:hypothetical protein